MSYSFLISLGAALGLLQIYRHNPSSETNRWVDGGLYTLVGILLGARLVFVLLHFNYYQYHLLETLQFWQGGLSAFGGIFGGIVTAGIFALLWKKPFFQITDSLVPLIPTLAVFAWLGCWQVGAAYGAAAPESAWWGVRTLDESGIFNLRFPLQIVAALLTFVFYGWLEVRPPDFRLTGMKTSVYISGLAAILAVSSLLRADSSPMFSGMRFDTMAGLVLLVLGLLAALYIRSRSSWA